MIRWKGLSHDDLVEECFEAVRQLRLLKQELEGKEKEILEERKEMERLTNMLEAQEAREQSYVKEIEFLTSKPLLCTVNTDSGQHIASLKDDQMRWQVQKLQAGLIISRSKGRFDTSRIKPAIQLKMASNRPFKPAAGLILSFSNLFMLMPALKSLKRALKGP